MVDRDKKENNRHTQDEKIIKKNREQKHQHKLDFILFALSRAEIDNEKLPPNYVWHVLNGFWL